MINFTPNSQTTVVVQPFQARKYLPSFTHYLLELESVATGAKYTLIFTPSIDNERYTKFVLYTNSNIPVSGSVLITESGRYYYRIYGQNSSTNLNVNDSSVVGLCEVGYATATGEDAWSTPSINIPNNVVYYE